MMFLDAGFSLGIQNSNDGFLPSHIGKNRGTILLARAAQAKDRNSAEAAVDLC